MPRSSLQRRFAGALALTLIPLLLVGLAGIAAVRISVGAFAEAAEEQAEETAPLNRLSALIRSSETMASEAFLGNADPAEFDRTAVQIAAELRRIVTATGSVDEQRSLRRASAAWSEARESLNTQLARPRAERLTDIDALDPFENHVRETESAVEATELAADAEAAAELVHAEAVRDRSQLVMGLLVLLGATTAFLVGRRLANAVLLPVRDLRKSVSRIGAGDLSHRVSADRDDELGELAKGMNAMAAELAGKRNELERNQQRLVQAQKMEAVGQLAGGIAHDFNNLLLVVGSYAEFLRDSFDEDDPRRADVAEIRLASERGATLTRQLLTFARRDVSQPLPLDAAATVAGLEDMIRRTVTATIDLRLDLERDLPPTVIDAGQLEQAVLNLVLNAQSAMPDGGSLTIRASTAELEEGQVEGAVPGAYVAISVSDTGHGMTADVRRRALEPFFTTRAEAGGTGLGLATVYGMVTGADGAIAIDSAPGEGTTVVLYLPVTTESVELPATETLAPSPERESDKVVLVAEDERTIRELTIRILAGHGYTVLAAASGIEALELARKTGRIDVLLTDVIMPGMTGGELAETLGRERPDLQVVFMSGYSDQIVAEHGVLDADTLYLAKPFRAQELLGLLGEALAPARAA